MTLRRRMMGKNSENAKNILELTNHGNKKVKKLVISQHRGENTSILSLFTMSLELYIIDKLLPGK